MYIMILVYDYKVFYIVMVYKVLLINLNNFKLFV